MEVKNELSNHEKIAYTAEQRACLDYVGSRTLMVKGVAGAGKSIVIQGLAQKYLKNYSQDQTNKVAIFTYSNTLSLAMREKLGIKKEQDSYIKVLTLKSYLYQIYKETAKKPLNFGPVYLSQKRREEAMHKALEIHKKEYGTHRFQNLGIDFWLKEITWMKSMNVSDKRDREYYLGLSRKGRGGKVRMSATDRDVAFQIFLIYDQELKERNQGEWNDEILYLLRNREQIPEIYKFDHVLIDEAQDMSLIDMLAVMKLGRKSVVIAMDMNQRIFPQQWTIKQLGIETATKKLTKSMRTTIEIDNLAESVRKRNDIFLIGENTAHAVPERRGPIPQVVHLEDDETEAVFIIRQVKSWIKMEKKLSIGIIASSKDQVKKYGTWMSDGNIPYEVIDKESTFYITRPGVKIVNAYNAKGLEFDIVIIPQFTDSNFPAVFRKDSEEELEEFLVRARNLIYVAMTRARYELLISYSGKKGSRFIAEMDSSCYEAKGESVSVELPKSVSVKKSTGFINWNGTTDDSYQSVIKYAQEKQQEEMNERKEREIRIWFAEKLGTPKYAGVQKTDILNLIIKKYKQLQMLYTNLTQVYISHTQILLPFDPEILWEDLWFTTLDILFEAVQSSNEQKEIAVNYMLNITLQLNKKTSWEEYTRELKKNERYRCYIRKCFSLEEKLGEFWKWIMELEQGGSQFSEEYKKCLLLMEYFFFLVTRSDKKGVYLIETRLEDLDLAKGRLLGDINYKILVNPLYDQEWKNKCKELYFFQKIILFFYKKNNEQDNGENKMIEELYRAFEDRALIAEKIDSILSSEIVQQLEKDILLELPKTGCLELAEEEKLFFLDHGMYYKESEKDGKIQFQVYKGTVYFTNSKIVFRGSYCVNLPYKCLKRVIQYDACPNILEFVCNKENYLMQIADANSAYKALKLIRKWNRGENIKEQPVMLTYEELVQKADFGACIFSLEYISSYSMPQELYSIIQELIQGLRGLQKTIEKYPEKKDEIDRFLSYYIPEAVRIVSSYQIYAENKIDQITMDRVYKKVREAVVGLNNAVKQKIYSIYQVATMNTIAQAEALREILGQAGFEEMQLKLNR